MYIQLELDSETDYNAKGILHQAAPGNQPFRSENQVTRK